MYWFRARGILEKHKKVSKKHFWNPSKKRLCFKRGFRKFSPFFAHHFAFPQANTSHESNPLVWCKNGQFCETFTRVKFRRHSFWVRWSSWRQIGRNFGRTCLASSWCAYCARWHENWQISPPFLGRKSCRTKIPRIFWIFVSDFAPNFAQIFPRIFRGFFVLRFVGNGDQKKFTKNPRHFYKQNSQPSTKNQNSEPEKKLGEIALPAIVGLWKPFSDSVRSPLDQALVRSTLCINLRLFLPSKAIFIS